MIRRLFFISLALIVLTAVALISSAPLQLMALKVYLTTYPKLPEDPVRLKAVFEHRVDPTPAPVSKQILKCCDVDENKIDGLSVYTVKPRQSVSSWHIVYTHGGAFVAPLLPAHWDIIENLITATGATVTVPLYPLAPEHDASLAFDFLEHVYRSVLETVPPEKIILAGDSAGANLALAQTFYFRQHRLPSPARVFLFSPWLDLTLANPEAKQLESVDPILTVASLREVGRWWAGRQDLHSPLMSPLFGDLTTIPPTWLFIGTDEIFLPDARLFQAKASLAGVQIHYYETPHAPHVFMCATQLRSAKEVYRIIGESFTNAN